MSAAEGGRGILSSHVSCWGAYLHTLNIFAHAKDLQSVCRMNFILCFGLLLPACLDMVLYLAYSGYDEPVGGYAFFLVMCILELITWLLGLITFTNPHMISTIAWSIMLVGRELSYLAFLIVCVIVVPTSSAYVPTVWPISCGANTSSVFLL
uniref:Uncharacterized protein n=1 Tax=Vannella robusta TaxID=1487602 RepID=A0A7S4MJI1_9EUKA